MSAIWIIGLLIAAFVLWHFLPRTPKKPAEPAPRYRHDPRISADEARWQEFVEEHCESPAEVAFLRAMITAFAMKPAKTALVAETVRLDFQVEEGRYRTDFLINHWLVVEIDGAAYHSSPEAIARDQKRDLYFEGLGYSVLRIPARVVLNTPAEAIDKVRAALAVGKRARPVEPVENQADGFQRLGQTLSGFKASMNAYNDTMTRQRAVNAAVSPAEIAVARERSVFDHMLKAARRKAEIEAWLGDDAVKRKIYEETLSDLQGLDPVEAEPLVIEPVHLTPPSLTGQADVDEEITARYTALVSQREDLRRSIQQTLRREPGLSVHAEAFLAKIEWRDAWARIR